MAGLGVLQFASVLSLGGMSYALYSILKLMKHSKKEFEKLENSIEYVRKTMCRENDRLDGAIDSAVTDARRGRTKLTEDVRALDSKLYEQEQALKALADHLGGKSGEKKADVKVEVEDTRKKGKKEKK